MASKSGGSRQRDVKKKIQKLKSAGLYRGDLRKEPTRYAKSLTRKYADVIEGRAKVVSVPKKPAGKSKGVQAARREARDIASKYGDIMQSKLDKLIVKVSHPKEKVGYSKKRGTVFTTINRGGEIETHEYIEIKNGQLPPLEKDQAYGLPVRRLGGELGYIMRATPEEIMALAGEYEMRPKHMYKGATGHIQIVYTGRLRKSRKRNAPKASNVIPFPGRKK